MKRWLKNILRILSGGSLALIIAACYGVPSSYNINKTFKTKDLGDKPIEGLKLTMVNTSTYDNTNTTETNTYTNAIRHTDQDGKAYFYEYDWNYGEFRMFIEDDDEITNGSWRSTNFVVSSENISETIEIEMKEHI